MVSVPLRSLAFVSIFLFPVFITAAPKVGIALHYDSLDEGCRNFITSQLYPTFQKLVEIMDVTLVPYGNTHEIRNGNEWRFVCQHGDSECVGNLIGTCAISILQDVHVYVPFIHCLETYITGSDVLDSARYCASKQEIDFDAIEKCQKGPQGNSLQHEMALKTNELVPRHYYVPWITLNGKHTEYIQAKATSDLLGLVCDTYKGTKPAACY